jgi:hypothetical protein
LHFQQFAFSADCTFSKLHTHQIRSAERFEVQAFNCSSIFQFKRLAVQAFKLFKRLDVQSVMLFKHFSNQALRCSSVSLLIV